MKILMWTLCLVMAAVGLFLAEASPALADGAAPGDPIPATATIEPGTAPVPGSAAEAAEYELREAASPEVQEYVGGHHVAVGLVGLLVVVLVVVLVVGATREV